MITREEVHELEMMDNYNSSEEYSESIVQDTGRTCDGMQLWMGETVPSISEQQHLSF